MDKYIKETDVFVKFDPFFSPADIIRARILIAQIPAADVRENVRGRWIYEKDADMFNCSKCGGSMVRNTYFYCPWCGAQMRGSNNV